MPLHKHLGTAASAAASEGEGGASWAALMLLIATTAPLKRPPFCRFESYDPDLVISVHPLMLHIPLRVLHRLIRLGKMDPINFATVVTDFTTCSNLWFSKRVTKCFVPTEFCANRARCAPVCCCSSLFSSASKCLQRLSGAPTVPGALLFVWLVTVVAALHHVRCAD